MSDLPATVPVCYRHPSRETYVRCSRCDRSICPDCMTAAAVGHQCPECVAEGRRTQRPARTAFGGGAAGRLGYVTVGLIGLNLLAALLGLVMGGAEAIAGRGLFTGASWIQAAGGVIGPPVTLAPNGDVFLGAYPASGDVFPGIIDGAYYRLITAMFIHYGLIHLLLNMWALWVLGRNLEAVLGPVRFAALYLLAGLGGNVAAYVVSPNSLAAGASTSIFGLFAAFFIVLRRLGRDTSVLVPILVINLVFTFVVASISIAGHLGGLFMGAVVAVILAYAPRQHRTLVQTLGCGGVFLFLIAVAVARTATLTG